MSKLDMEYFKVLHNEAVLEKFRTDDKYGAKEETGRDKAVVVSCIVENLGALLDKMRYVGDVSEVEKYYVRMLAHVLTLSIHVKEARIRKAQYITEEEIKLRKELQ